MVERSAKRSTASLVLDALAQTRKPLSAYELLGMLRQHGIKAPPTIYRALAALIKRGQVHQLQSVNAFVACSHRADTQMGHSHGDLSVGFAICDACGCVEEFVDPLLKARIEADAAAGAFKARTSSVEIHGLCAKCETAGLP